MSGDFVKIYIIYIKPYPSRNPMCDQGDMCVINFVLQHI